jgi:superfamily II DNA or RNA helicase
MSDVAKIVIEDEVNVHIQNIDLSTKKALVKEVEFFLPQARYSAAYKLGRWDGCTSFCTLGGKTYLNALDKLLPVLQDRGYEFEIEDQRAFHKFDFQLIDENYLSDLTWPFGHRFANQNIVMRDYQVEAINVCLQNLQGVNVLPTSAGKCQPLYAKVKTPDGWTTMGELKVGDQVMTPKGNCVQVQAVFDPGHKDVYELTFKDGRKVRSCEDHVWPIFHHDWQNKFKLLSLKEVIALKNKTRRCIGVPLATMDQDIQPRSLPLDPYLLGAMLGDGSFRHNIGFTSQDQFILDKVSSLLHSDYVLKHCDKYDWSVVFKDHATHMTYRSEYTKTQKRDTHGKIIKDQQIPSYHLYKSIIDKLGLMGTYSHTKFIPEIYLNASYTQRIELIKGLMDTDGYVSKRGDYSYTTVSPQLAADFVYLIRSVGGIAYTKILKNRSYVNKSGDRIPAKDAYTVRLYHPTPELLVSLPRKIERLGNSKARTIPVLHITHIKKVSHEPVKCIMIDDPDHLYLTDDFVMTHNTIVTATLSKIVEPHGRSIVIVPNKNLVQQTEEDYRNIGLDVGVLYGDRKEYDCQHTICTWQSLNVLDKKHKDCLDNQQMDVFLKDLVCIICDECHAIKDQNILHKLMTTVFKNIPIRWGLTGTIPEEEFKQMGLFTAIGPQIGALTAKELQDKGVLAQCHVSVLQTQENLQYGNYQEELKYLLTDDKRLAWMAGVIEEISQSGNTLVLVDRIETGQKLYNQISNSVFISGEMKSNDRREHYKEINFSDNKIMIATYGTTSTGINISRIFNLVLVEAGKSFVRTIQSIGRGLRMADDKNSVEIYDLCSRMKFSNNHSNKRKAFYSKAQYPYVIKKITY